MLTTQTALFAAGGALEVVGIFLVSWPDLAPLVRAGRERASDAVRRAVDRVRRALGRPRHHVVGVASAGGIALDGSARGEVSISPDATADEKIALLLRRDLDTQRMLDTLGERLSEQARDTEERLDSARREMEQHVASEIRRALDVYRRLRLVGIGVLVFGTVLVSLGNFA